MLDTDSAIAPITLIAPVAVSGIFVALTSLFKEPTRQQFSALMIAGAGFVYFGGGFRFWEVGYGALFLWLAFRSLSDYRFVGLGWILHVVWDILHHLYGHPILPFIPLSSFGCAICDTGIALWYFLGAPSVWTGRKQSSLAATSSAFRMKPSPKPNRSPTQRGT